MPCWTFSNASSPSQGQEIQLPAPGKKVDSVGSSVQRGGVGGLWAGGKHVSGRASSPGRGPGLTGQHSRLWTQNEESVEPGAAASQRGQETRAQGTSPQQPAISGLWVWPQKDRGVKRLPGEPAGRVQLSGVLAGTLLWGIPSCSADCSRKAEDASQWARWGRRWMSGSHISSFKPKAL